MRDSTAGHGGPDLFSQLPEPGLFDVVQARPAALVGAEGLHPDAMALAPGYAGEDRNAAARHDVLIGAAGWSEQAAAAVTGLVVETPALHERPAATQEALAAEVVAGNDSPKPLTGSARTARVEKIRRMLAVNGHAPTDLATREQTAWQTYLSANGNK